MQLSTRIMFVTAGLFAALVLAAAPDAGFAQKGGFGGFGKGGGAGSSFGRSLGNAGHSNPVHSNPVHSNPVHLNTGQGSLNQQHFTYTSPSGNTFDSASVSRTPPVKNTLAPSSHGGGLKAASYKAETSSSVDSASASRKPPFPPIICLGGLIPTFYPQHYYTPSSDSGYVRVITPDQPVNATAVVVLPPKVKTPVNKLPTYLVAQSVTTACDTALARAEPLPSLTTEVADGSVIDVAPHLLAYRVRRVNKRVSENDPAEKALTVVDGERSLPAEATATQLKGVYLVNPDDAIAPINYLLNGYPFTLKPGKIHQLPSEAYTIEFDKGGNLGSATFGLDDGTYAFSVSQDKGWKLSRKSFKVVVDNSGNPNPFAFTVNGKETTVAGGLKKEVASKYPIMAAFDPGDSGPPARRWLTDGVYKVGVDSQAKLLDLYRTASLNQPKPKPFPEAVPNLTGS